MSISPIDPRGPQFNAALTSVLLAAVMVTATTPAGVVLLAVQAALFASAVLFGVQRTPAAYLFRRFVRPRLTQPTALEDPRPVRFAQGIGLGFAVLGLAGFVSGPTWLGYAAVGAALIAALLNATVQVCLGCKIYGVCHLPQDHYEDIQSIQSNQSNNEKKEATV
jgi:hypothetical protein